MIRVTDATVKVAQLVESHLLEIGFMEIVGQSLFEVDSETLVEEIEEGVHERGGDSDQSEIEHSLDED